ncbi:Rho-binding antiterminator [Vibrio maritimus]|uniref:Rho-binding antiterminator n=1 Tax=Vibrio chaetopteri TaxID=3016528 RepID=A0AAU8BG51_9VIBR
MISCSDYDYVEIACMHRYPVRLSMKNGQKIEGTALDTTRNDVKAECIKLSQQSGERLVELDQIASIEVLTANPHFVTKVFS